ncbi:MAG: hypothetical protein MnENMB40S_13950 [Rhizobiaceae bacterium MnEN-MB40S]|nr:MAG: hypothetical protein MnENMB40S_13950 [Rhizobiaceae bacterium MnEN-MB40S]
MVVSPTDTQVAPNGRLAIIAGRGRLPFDVAAAARRAGEDPYIIALTGETGEEVSDYDHTFIGLASVAQLHQILRDNAIDRVVMSGGVNRRPELSEVRIPFRLVSKLPAMVKTLFSGGDDKLLRLVIRLIESEDCRVVGAQEVIPDLLATTGPLTTKKPNRTDWKNIEAARKGALALGRLDVGQGAVAVSGRIVALEGAEGTDAMIERVAELRRTGRISATKKGALVKFCKPQQDERADLPSIGTTTIENIVRAGLSGVAVEAGRSLVLEREQTVDLANETGVFIVGIGREETPDGRVYGSE